MMELLFMEFLKRSIEAPARWCNPEGKGEPTKRQFSDEMALDGMACGRAA
ncbi:hypothetical protein KSF_003530 [Reticulibacter mediterranei]|uniref:Uncharacterized protein n=1 Tax=Reticulibacter mediterranei TaxID=2778369 RepID=A0A8J3ID92_9CHLR|nr:hypothetical protein KSF_003530 [Reticulibacter mediterranei]